jgi:hypothetical protein
MDWKEFNCIGGLERIMIYGKKFMCKVLRVRLDLLQTGFRVRLDFGFCVHFLLTISERPTRVDGWKE